MKDFTPGDVQQILSDSLPQQRLLLQMTAHQPLSSKCSMDVGPGLTGKPISHLWT